MINHAGAEIKLFRETWANTITADGLVPFGARPSAPMKSTV